MRCLQNSFAVLLFSSVAFWAQSPTATISGRVLDPTRAVISGASVDAINVATNTRHTAQTNGSGLFSIVGLTPGAYRVEISKAGFKNLVKTDVVLHVQDVVAVNFDLSVGSASETVTVEGGAPLVNTQDASVSTVVDRDFVANIPLNGRSFQSLISLSPGVVLTRSDVNEQGQFSVNGQRADANYFMVDGVSANISASSASAPGQSVVGAVPAVAVTGGTNSLVSVDALQEFRIETSTYAPEFGRTPGAQISIATRAGTNQFHGTAFDYFRNDVLDANDWFSGYTNNPPLQKPKERQNDFGGVLGGPIWRNRTFFFFSYEGLRLRQPNTRTDVVPSLNSRQTAVAAIRPFLNAYPFPNGPDLTNGFAQFAASYSDPSTLNATSLRIDHALSSRLTLFARYNYAPSFGSTRGSATALSNVNDRTLNAETATFGATATMTPQVTNDFRGNYSRSTGKSKSHLDSFGQAVPPPDSVLFPSFTSSDDAVLLFLVIGGSSYSVGKSVTNVQHQLNFIDNVSLMKGTHQLKVGVDYRRLALDYGPRSYEQLDLFLGVLGSRGAISGVPLINRVTAHDAITVLSTNLSAYCQDTWKIRPKLTTTYGIRWDINPPLSGADGKDLFTVQGLDNPITATLAPQGTPLYHTAYRNFAPRIGAAYQLSEVSGRETVVRGGIGIFYDIGSGALGNTTNFFPYTRLKKLPAGTPFPLAASQATPPAFSLNPPFGTVVAPVPNLALPRTFEWNIALEQSLGSNQVLSGSYVGAAGRRLLRQETVTNPNPNFTSISILRNAASSDYHALELKLQRRLSRHLQALASYTWSHSIDIASNDSGVFASANFVDPQIDRASSDFDVRHSFTGAVTYNLPTLNLGAIGGALLHDWFVDGFFSARSALPVDLIGKTSVTGFSGNVRPDVVPGVVFYLEDPSVPGGRRFNPAAFKVPAGRQGTLGRNSLRGFAVGQWDFAVGRQFVLEKLQLQFRAEFFNILNHPNFGDPGAAGNGTNNITSPLFGQSTQTLGKSQTVGGFGLNSLYQLGGPRSVQLALKLVF